METNQKILVLLTGGTICSTVNAKGERDSDVGSVRIVEAFRHGDSPNAKTADFDIIAPLDVLSENMTPDTWNRLLGCFRSQVDWERYCGIIVLHGTDTLAYTASMLSIALAGAPIPICLVSAQLPLVCKDTNGHANFGASVDLILGGIAPNVYAVYRNMNGTMYIHYGAHLRQCESYSNDFYSVDAMEMRDALSAAHACRPFENDARLYEHEFSFSSCVLKLTPYVGMDYAMLSLQGVRAIVQETYHSESVCVERSGGEGAYSSASLLWLADRCKELGIPLLLSPCSSQSYRYESTGDALRRGVIALYGTTAEMAYAKLLLGCALGYDGEKLVSFAQKSINYEFIY